MSKIVCIFSSPRADGNSCTIGRAVLDGAMGLSVNTIKIHRLNSLFTAKGCQNCDRCRDNYHCYIEDDMKPILEDIVECDSLVVCFPLFFNGPCAQFKLLMDRMYSQMTTDLKPRFPGKKLVMVITHDDPDSDEQAKLVEDQLSSIFVDKLGYDVVGVVNYRCNRDFNSAKHDQIIMNVARELGKKI